MHAYPFSRDWQAQTTYMTEQMRALTEHHRRHCPAYQAMLDGMGYDSSRVGHYSDIPFLPVTLFKKFRLSSVDEPEDTKKFRSSSEDDSEDIKLLTSSGTSGQQRSQIILDGETRELQQKALSRIGTDFLGGKRMPMLVIDCPSTVKDRRQFSARTAGILGFSLFGGARCYALRDEDMSLDLEAVEGFLARHGDKPFLIFGFTAIVWQYFVLELERQGKAGYLDCKEGILVHGGGWKKLQDQAVGKAEYKARLEKVCGLKRVMDYYGMAEQSGSIFMECECGHLHVSDYSGILIRRPMDFSLCEVGETGLIQVLSELPRSYPGHSLLTEDMGRILGVDDCPCGRKGTYFEVLGRAKKAELRGCSDTFAANSAKVETAFRWLLGSDEELERMIKESGIVPFHERTKAFLSEVSNRLRHHPMVRANLPDVMTFAFWIRRAHLEEMEKEQNQDGRLKNRIGRGLSLHYTSSNLPVIFAYSMAAALLAGNTCLIRMSGRESLQEQVILQVIQEVTTQVIPKTKNRILVCRYGHDKAKNDAFAAISDARIMWGGDASIAQIQQSPLKAQAVELAFGNRYSAAVLDAKQVVEAPDLEWLVKDFYNDTYLNDQNACSSPRVICWMGKNQECAMAQNRFWPEVEKLLREKAYQVEASVSVAKWDGVLSAAASCGQHGNAKIYPGINEYGNQGISNLVNRVSLSELSTELWEHTVPGGMFIECSGEDMSGVLSVIREDFQTLTVYGMNVEKVQQELLEKGCTQVRRIVPMGHSLDFSLTWDGHDLIEELSENILNNE